MTNVIKINSDFLVVSIHSIINFIFIVFGVFMTDIIAIPAYLSSIMGIWNINYNTSSYYIIFFNLISSMF